MIHSLAIVMDVAKVFSRSHPALVTYQEYTRVASLPHMFGGICFIKLLWFLLNASN